MRQSKPSLLLPLLNRIDWHSMTSPRAESADTWSRTFSSEIPVSVAISESSRSPRSFRYFRISCKADYSLFSRSGCVGSPKRGAIFYAKVTDLARFPGFRRQGFDRAAICITIRGSHPIRAWKNPRRSDRDRDRERTRRIARLGGLGGERAGLLRTALCEVLRPLGDSRDVLLSSFSPSPGLQHLGVSHVSQVSQDLPPIRCAVEWRDSLTGFASLG